LNIEGQTVRRKERLGLKDFFRPPEKFISDTVATNPYEKAKKVWDDRDGHLRLQNFNLRRICWGLLLVCIILAGGLIFQSTKSTVAPYVIEVDSTTGMARNVGLVQSQQYQPKEAENKYFLSEFIKNTREIPLDPVVYEQKWQTAYAYMTQSAANKMNVVMQQEQPLQYLGKKTVQVHIVVMVPMGNNSYQVRWTEEEFNVSNGQKTVVPMSGVFTIYLSPPKSEKEIQTNPLGIYISDFNWAKEIPSGKQ
jgi:type IV secretion system protein VirB5